MTEWRNRVGAKRLEELLTETIRLAVLAAEYLDRRTRRAELLEEARELGHQYGRELAALGLPLSQAVEAFIFFRRSLDDTTRQSSERNGLSAVDALRAEASDNSEVWQARIDAAHRHARQRGHYELVT